MDFQFGEIVEPTSRAFWNDYDEIGDERQEFPEIKWIWQNEENQPQLPSDLEIFLIVEGFGVLDFMNSILLKNQSPVCHLSIGQASIYHLPNQKLAVCLTDEKDLNYFSPMTTAMDPWMKAAKNVYAISFHSASTYKGEEISETVDGCFIRGVNSKSESIKELEVPNIITGISAGVVSYCKFHKREASAFVVYMESPIFDSITTKPIIKLFKELNVPCDNSYSLKQKSESGLYM
uniref:Proteasome assembly chaperone 1 n=1 Tax=Culicoides sonorensis TaxID=179676 RepID=A0A336MA93_CULSO